MAVATRKQILKLVPASARVQDLVAVVLSTAVEVSEYPEAVLPPPTPSAVWLAELEHVSPEPITLTATWLSSPKPENVNVMVSPFTTLSTSTLEIEVVALVMVKEVS